LLEQLKQNADDGIRKIACLDSDGDRDSNLWETISKVGVVLCEHAASGNQRKRSRRVDDTTLTTYSTNSVKAVLLDIFVKKQKVKKPQKTYVPKKDKVQVPKEFPSIIKVEVGCLVHTYEKDELRIERTDILSTFSMEPMQFGNLDTLRFWLLNHIEKTHPNMLTKISATSPIFLRQNKKKLSISPSDQIRTSGSHNPNPNTT
jgi:hypothetical protein